MDSWENEDFEVTMPAKALNKWEGEDEDDEVKDSWDDPEEEKKEEDSSKTQAVSAAKKPKKALLGKIEEKERKRKEEIEKKLSEKQASLTPEEQLAEKIRRQKLQEESDLLLAKQLLGTDGISLVLETPEDFEKFKDDIINKLGDSTKKENFPNFVDQLVQSLCVHLNSTDLKKLSTWLNNMHIEKLKIEKGDKGKKNKGKGKAKLKLEGETDYNEFSAYTEDYDDFM
ncbi:eukaryotic translation initiation factor 3 subunit J [Macrosteles quadrilineatus]|uniref:eukaryotic translation initiation factor 3 subunit J n=1 Tax=Macrosteles quadrilineatus TaxID=74068 RepID=UPI0023E2B5AA|nr:eukaryotic translation initiation factor 3 subunit J [Macrosteles quadrilineatus]